MRFAMEKKENHFRESDKKYAAVCGLYCKACSWFISTNEDPERLNRLAAQRNWSVEESRCYGCRSGKRLPYCEKCIMFACAAERGIDFCSECEEYPCNDLKEFQSAMPHRIELWVNLGRIKSVGYKQWLKEIKHRFSQSYNRHLRTRFSCLRYWNFRFSLAPSSQEMVCGILCQGTSLRIGLCALRG